MKFEQKSIFFKRTYHLFALAVSASDLETFRYDNAMKPGKKLQLQLTGPLSPIGAQLKSQTSSERPWCLWGRAILRSCLLPLESLRAWVKSVRGPNVGITECIPIALGIK